MKKKIIFVTKALWIGGIETALINLLNNFDYSKYDVTLLVTKAELDMLERICDDVNVIVIDRDNNYTFNRPYKYKRLFHLTEETTQPSFIHRMMMWTVPIIKYIENVLYIKYIKDLMKDQEFDTAIIYSDVVGEITIKAIKANKYLMYYHHGAMRHVYHDNIAYKKCEKIIAVSKNQAESLKQFVPKYKDKIIVINNLVDVAGILEKAKMSIEEYFDPNKINIVTVGRVSYEKGMDIAVNVCAKLVNEGYNNIKWWIVGDGPVMNDVKKLIKNTNMNDYINLVGMKDNPYPYISKADLYVQPSRVESFGLTILEAMVLQKYVISTDTAGAREIITNHKNGLLCKNDIEEISSKLDMMINSTSIKNHVSIYELDFKFNNLKNIRLFESIL